MAVAFPSTSGRNEQIRDPKRKPELIFKVLVVGDPGAGKTALANRYTMNQFHIYHRTDGFNLFTKEIETKGFKIILNIIDIGGREGTSMIGGTYFFGSTGVIIVRDGTKWDRFYTIADWVLKIRESLPLPKGEVLPCILLLNKCDLEEEVESTQLILTTNYLRQNNILKVFQTSAKTKKNLAKAFEYLLFQMMTRFPKTITLRDARTDPLVIEDREFNKSLPRIKIRLEE